MREVILNFHGVGPMLRDVSGGERDCWLETDRFAEILDCVQGAPHVQLTFDDGNASDFEVALPLLLERKLTATFFVCSQRLDQPTFLRRDQVTGLLTRGMRIGSHGAAHVPWRGLPDPVLQEELGGSRAILEQVCGRTVDTAACPFGSYDRRVLAALRRAGYRATYTSDGGTVRDAWLKARTTVTSSMPVAKVRQLVRSGPAMMTQAGISLRTFLKRQR